MRTAAGHVRWRLGLGAIALATFAACGGGSTTSGTGDEKVAAAVVTTTVAPITEVTSAPETAPTTTTTTTTAALPPPTTARPAPPVTQAVVAAPPATIAAETDNCHPSYPGDCIPPAPPDLNCPDIARKVRVDHAFGDPHGFDRDGDGFGCESYG